MVEDEPGVVRAVAWSELLPWLRIYRTFRLAVSVRVLLLAAVATAGFGFLAASTLGFLVPETLRRPRARSPTPGSGLPRP